MRTLTLLLLSLPAVWTAAASFEADHRAAVAGFHSLARPLELAPIPDALGPEERLHEEDEFDALEEEGVPADLTEAGARWNTNAQLAKLPADPGALRFAVLGDVEAGRFIWSRVLFGRKGVYSAQLKRIKEEDADFVLQLGDMVSRGIVRNYRRFYKELDGAGLAVPYLTTIGNHDRHSPHGDAPADLYEDLFGPRDYSFESGGVRFVSVDTSGSRLTPGQLAWLDLVLNTDKRKIVYTHMPPAQFKGWTLGMTGIKEGGEEFVALMARHRVDRVYMGHIHGYGIAQKDGVRYVLTGGGGSPLYWLPSKEPDLFYHYLTVEVGPGGVRETVHPLDGEPFEIAWPGAQDFELLVKS